MNLTTSLDLLTGWSIGYQYTDIKRKEDEVKQGKNYIISSMIQIPQIGILTTLMMRIAAKTLPEKYRSRSTVLFGTVQILSLPLTILMGAIKQGEYDAVKNVWNKYIPIRLPQKLGSHTIAVSNFFAEHGGNMIRVAMIAGVTALLCLKDYAYAGAALTAVLYEAIDKMGWVNRRISLFMEKYLYLVATMGGMIGGSLITRVLSSISLPVLLLTSCKNYLYEKIDQCVHKSFQLIGPTLAEMHRPRIEQKEMPYEKMLEILHAPLGSGWWSYPPNPAFKIQPSHCSKWVTEQTDLPVDTHFDKLIPLFDAIDWKPNKDGTINSNVKVMINRLKDDERFIDFVYEQFPGTDKKEIEENFQDYFTELVKKSGKTEREYAVAWTRQQMVLLTDVLMGRTRAAGRQTDLDDAIHNISQLLPYLDSLKKEKKLIDYTDGLLKLAIEGGGYCPRAIKRVSIEMLTTLMRQSHSSEMVDSATDYERKLRQCLQDERFKIVEKWYTEITEEAKFPDTFSKDVHTSDLYRQLLCLGFAPLTKHEEDDISLLHLYLWEWYYIFRQDMFKEYKNESLEFAMKEIGEIHFFTYFKQLIETHPKLNETQKEHLLSLYTERNDDQWSLEVTYKKFHRLVYVMLGILDYKPQTATAA